MEPELFRHKADVGIKAPYILLLWKDRAQLIVHFPPSHQQVPLAKHLSFAVGPALDLVDLANASSPSSLLGSALAEPKR